MDALQIQKIRDIHFDVIIVGSGVGGSTMALALGQAGLKVLVLEKGGVPQLNQNNLGFYAESKLSLKKISANPKALTQFGRSGAVWNSKQNFIPFVGEGAGGSSSLYGMAMEPFDKEDFTPSKKHITYDGLLPDWPLSFDDYKSNLKIAQMIFGVRNCEGLKGGPSYSAANQELIHHLKNQAISPYKMPMACEYKPGCRECQGVLCPLDCKRDSYNSCLQPAIDKFGVHFLADCEVTKLHAKGDQVTEVVARLAKRELIFKADTVVLAAGAVATPALLMNSNNLANSSGLVGKYLMRHLIDLYAIKTQAKVQENDFVKQFAFRDLVREPNVLGYIQSFGRLPGKQTIKAEFVGFGSGIGPQIRSLLFPFVNKVFIEPLESKVILASTLEDMPNIHNKVTLSSSKQIQLQYAVSSYDRLRAKQTRSRMRSLLQGYSVTLLSETNNNKRIAHACGTCRMGEESATSVVGPSNRAHDIKNLYVVDSSFFPTSSSYNPSLTIAANAFRVCKEMTGQGFNYREFCGDQKVS